MTKRKAEQVIEEIAQRMNMPADEVAALYASTNLKLAAGAKIHDYLPVIVAKQVQEDIRRQARHAKSQNMQHTAATSR